MHTHAHAHTLSSVSAHGPHRCTGPWTVLFWLNARPSCSTSQPGPALRILLLTPSVSYLPCPLTPILDQSICLLYSETPGYCLLLDKIQGHSYWWLTKDTSLRCAWWHPLLCSQGAMPNLCPSSQALSSTSQRTEVTGHESFQLPSPSKRCNYILSLLPSSCQPPQSLSILEEDGCSPSHPRFFPLPKLCARTS